MSELTRNNRAGESNTIPIGTAGTHNATFIAGINGTALGSAVPVGINAAGQLGTPTSSARFKKEIKPMEKASESILALQAVTFRYKDEFDPKGMTQFGLVAEEVKNVNPALIVRDDDGKAYSVRYEAVNAMLPNEFLKEHRKGQQQDLKIEKLEATVAQLELLLSRQSAQLEKITEQLVTTKTARRLAANDQ